MFSLVSKLNGSLKNQSFWKFSYRILSTGSCRKGFEEFFPPGVYEGENHAEENSVVGRGWKISELRIRSNTDLHKFWYVLLKEKNMLLTLDQECKRLGLFVPGGTRLHKVEQTMDLVERVVKERETAINLLENERRYKFDDNNSPTKNDVNIEEELFENKENVANTS